MQTTLLSPKLLKPNPWNSNRVSAGNMEKLRRSIRDLGFASSVVCRRLPNGDLQILGGHHRVMAAVAEGIEQIPVLILEDVDDAAAMKIGQVDNSRYGTDDAIALARIYDNLGMSDEELAAFLPFAASDLSEIRQIVDVDLGELDLITDDPGNPEEFVRDEYQPEARTHDIMKFRIGIADAEKIRSKVTNVIKKQGFNDRDEMTAAGDALSYILLGAPE